MISVSIVNFNEAKKLKECLKNIQGFADEIIIVDLGSTDTTKKVCKKFKATIYFHKSEPYVELIRDFSISKTKGDWVLILDPDEKIGEDLKQKLKNIIENPGNFVAVNIPRKNIFFGKWISHTNWWPDRHIRFFKKGKVKWNDKIHSYPEVDGEILNLEAKEEFAIIHYGYDSITEFIQRQNRYSDIEADNLYKQGIRFSWKGFFWKPIREFLVRYIRHSGFLDRFWGFSLTFLMMIYQLEIMIKLWELERSKT